jgi:hypothetical protein
MGGSQLGLAVVSAMWLASCAPCAEDELEPNGSDSPAEGGEISFELNELDINFHDQSDIDCVAYVLNGPSQAEDPRVYVELKGGEEEIDLSITFACASGDPATFVCDGESPEEPACAKSGKEPSLGFTYDCDAADDAQLGDASIVVCATRPAAEKLCVDYTIRAFLN